ncbi:diphthine--ammonia ligase [Tissierella creatinini]|nr:diphthine--ammonia ligase [Tissierella creatinini]TJX63903.1 diphthine--ammonia ligase [Soehngenia saccharolytica]
MTNLKGKKFVASYSSGKDSTLAIYRAISQGLIPMELIITYNVDKERSWFHGIPQHVLDNISKQIDIPISLIKTKGEEYEKNFEAKLLDAKKKGAEVCIFGDIDLEAHLEWCTDRCKAVGLEAYFPLWKESRKSLVYEFIDLGFKTIITVVDSSRMPEDFVGKILTREVAAEIEKSGADICGENGEYHTFVFDGPLFKNKVEFEIGEIIRIDNFTIAPIQ